MYLRAIHADATIAMLRQLIRDNPLGILTTAISSDNLPLIQSSHVPFLLDVNDESSETELGVLRGHLARANPQSKAMIESLSSKTTSPTRCPGVLEQDVHVLFNAPVQHYVTPKFYTQTKPETGKVVPTWNYAAAQVYGRARIYYDANSSDSAGFLGKQIHDLTQHAEQSVMGYTGVDGKPSGWSVDDAPERYIQLLQKAIIGIEITVERLEGKFKMSQELAKGDREGVVRGFEALGSESHTAARMAEVVKERGELKDSK